MRTIEERVEELEQSVRRWRRAATGLVLCLVLILAAALGLQSATAQEGLPSIDANSVTARYINLVNDEGKTVIELSAQGGYGVVTVSNTSTYSAVQLSADETGYVHVSAADGSNRAFQP